MIVIRAGQESGTTWDLYARWRSLSLFSLVEYWSWTTINCTLPRIRDLSTEDNEPRGLLLLNSQLIIMLWVIYVVWCKLWSNWKLYPHFGRLFLISKLRYTCIYKNQFLCRFDYSLIFFSDYHACIMDNCIVCFVNLISLYVFHRFYIF